MNRRNSSRRGAVFEEIPHAEAQRTQREERGGRVVVRFPCVSFMLLFIIKIRKSIVENAQLGGNTPSSAPLRALRDEFIKKLKKSEKKVDNPK